MLFAISGAQGQGKTTTLQELSKSHINGTEIRILQNQTSRSILNDWGYTLNEINKYTPLTKKFQEEILTRHSTLIRDAASAKEIYFCERSFADIFTYCLFILGPFNEYSSWLNEYYERCKKLQTECFKNVFFLTGRTYVPQDDGVRSINLQYAGAVDTLLIKHLSEFTPNFTIIDTPNLTDRVNNILSTMGKHL